MEIHIDDNITDTIVIASLKQDLSVLESLYDSWLQRIAVAVFSEDPEKDGIAIKEHIDAINLLIEYYDGHKIDDEQ